MTEWTMAVGLRPHRVVAEERTDRGGRVYLRWWEDGNWRRKATGLTIRTAGGVIVKSRVAKVEKAAKEVNARLANQQGAFTDEVRPITLSDGLAAVIDRNRGKYPKDTPHRREVQREMVTAVAILGDREWASLRPGDIRTLYRKRSRALQAKGHTGKRGAEVTVARFLAVAQWLRDEELIPVGACRAPKDWREALGDELNAPDPKRPRHTVDELRRILAVADQVDPRLALALELGAELRLGQVLRVRRSDLDLTTNLLRVRGAGNKRGTLVSLIPTQRQAVDRALAGYLAPLEATGDDYHLFPAGQLTGGRTSALEAVCRPEHATARPIHRRAALAWFHAAEALAGVPHVEGRGWYGLRRAGVDGAKGEGISREGLKEFGGWSDTQVPDRIYADQNALVAVNEAANIRATIRGVDTPEPYPPRAHEQAPKGEADGGQS